MAIFAVAPPFRHLTFLFGTEALTRFRVVVVAKLNNCRVPSSVWDSGSGAYWPEHYFSIFDCCMFSIKAVRFVIKLEF